MTRHAQEDWLNLQAKAAVKLAMERQYDDTEEGD